MKKHFSKIILSLISLLLSGLLFAFSVYTWATFDEETQIIYEKE